jgi:hypothetical protein
LRDRSPFISRKTALALNYRDDGVTKSNHTDPLDPLRQANQAPPPKRAADLVPYDYYSSHPEHRPRRLSRRRLRRRLIREG